MEKIPLHIISGFLGSGKTTFLKRVIEKYSGEIKIGIIQNEFAPANIDGVELKQTGKDFQLLEINNGSVFCACLLGDFTRRLEKFIDETQPEVIIMEASGLSDTTSICEILSSGAVAEKIYLASNWCIVDAQNFRKTGLMKQRAIHQLLMADIIVINKIDLSQAGVAKIKEEIKKMNPFAKIMESIYCDIDIELGQIPEAKFYLGQVESMARPDINSMAIKSSRKLSYESLKEFLNEWASKAYRIKGFVNLKTGETTAVQCTFNQVSLKPIRKSFHPTELIAISEKFTLREWNKSFKEYSKS
ncbi:MAG: hypothetical protein GXO81_11675 [Chlorobi bacterium]|nr:hypothetical protein [Chlorobiota bacterium]